MSVILRTWAILVVALKRLFSQKGLALATVIGLVAAVALTMSVPLYADAVYYRILRAGLFDAPAQEFGASARPPFAFMFRYVGSWYQPLEWDKVQPLDQYISNAGPGGINLGLPRMFMVRHFKTDNFKLFPMSDVAYADVKEPLAWVSYGFASDVQDHIDVMEGEFPPAADASVDSPIPVAISEARATELGLQVGEQYMTFAPKTKGTKQAVQIPIVVSGVWKPKDANEDYWFYEPSALEDMLIIPEQTFLQRISPVIENEVYVALWYLVLDGSNVHAADAGPLLGRIVQTQQKVSALLPNTALAISPVTPLQAYQKSARLLTVLLYAFSVPILGLLLAFIALMVGLTVGQKRNEIAVLRSRGATAVQVVGIAALEGVILGLIALVLAVPASEWVARTIGRATSFLNFTALSDLRVVTTANSLRYGLIAAGLTMVAQMVPTMGAARHTIVTYKQERARSLKPPWWQRMYLDVALLIPAVYGTYLLRKQGSIVLPGATANTVTTDPFQNPLLFLVPALMVFACTLLLLRVLPFIMAALAWLASQLGSVGTMLAARQLSRTPGYYAGPLMLLVLTLSLSAYTASLAQTLDNHLYDQTYYKIGADMRVVELGEDTQAQGGGFGFSMGTGGNATAGSDQATKEPTGPRWNFLPVSEYLKVPGVKASTRIAEYPATTRLSGGTQKATFVGVDRVDFSKVAFWRRDFAPYRLGYLMNALATTPEGILLHRTFMAQNALRVGDTVRVAVDTYGVRSEMDMKVVGSFDLFPTWYPDGEDGTLIVGNLDYLYEQAGDQYPYEVLLRTDGQQDYDKLVSEMRTLNLNVLDYDATLAVVAREQRRPERQGLFGFLSIGFAAAALLTVLGFLLYALFSFRRRFIELGMLRAIGLSSGQMTSFLAWELAFLILVGLVAGTLLGVWVSNLFVPYLQVGAGAAAHIPPFLVEIAWPAIFRIWGLFVGLFVIALVVLAVLLLRMRIFQAVKLGETA